MILANYIYKSEESITIYGEEKVRLDKDSKT